MQTFESAHLPAMALCTWMPSHSHSSTCILIIVRFCAFAPCRESCKEGLRSGGPRTPCAQTWLSILGEVSDSLGVSAHVTRLQQRICFAAAILTSSTCLSSTLFCAIFTSVSFLSGIKHGSLSCSPVTDSSTQCQQVMLTAP